jgi:hypothetical protein
LREPEAVQDWIASGSIDALDTGSAANRRPLAGHGLHPTESTFGSPGETEPPAGERIGLLADPNIS